MNYGRSYRSLRSSEKFVQNRCRPKLNGISPLKLVIISLAGPGRNDGATFTVRLTVRIVHQEAQNIRRTRRVPSRRLNGPYELSS
jgi:hypothetical protein